MSKSCYIAGGCSFTLGNELSDDVDGKQPSKKSWAYRLMDETKYGQLINKSKWSKIPIFNHKESNRRKALLITKSEFMKDLKSRGSSNNKIDLIPILMFNKDKYEIHHIMIVEINNDTNIGISFIYDNKYDKM